jgi:lipopolysaccharide/colanic/teichoic acid biosynthesis glycosyltransferase
MRSPTTDGKSERILAIAHETGATTANGSAYLVVKRSFDVLAGGLILLVLSPLLLVAALLIKLDSRGPVFFRQQRTGLGGEPFKVWKFRTMRTDADPEVHRRYIEQLVRGEVPEQGLKKLVDDPRVTRVGHFLRRTSIDELPQLFNVMSGEMSIVGPRPGMDYELEHYLPRHYRRFDVRPGITGLWQVSGRNQLDFVEMLDLDVRYVDEMGPWMDLKVLAKTPMAMVGKGA